MGPKSNCNKVAIWFLHMKCSGQILAMVSLLTHIKLFQQISLSLSRWYHWPFLKNIPKKCEFCKVIPPWFFPVTGHFLLLSPSLSYYSDSMLNFYVLQASLFLAFFPDILSVEMPLQLVVQKKKLLAEVTEESRGGLASLRCQNVLPRSA